MTRLPYKFDSVVSVNMSTYYVPQIRHTSGVICSPITRTRAEELRLPLMVPENEDTHHTAFTVTVDLHQRHGTTTGISAEQRAATVRALASGAMASGDFQRPGHVFPLRY